MQYAQKEQEAPAAPVGDDMPWDLGDNGTGLDEYSNMEGFNSSEDFLHLEDLPDLQDLPSEEEEDALAEATEHFDADDMRDDEYDDQHDPEEYRAGWGTQVPGLTPDTEVVSRYHQLPAPDALFAGGDSRP